MIPQTRFARSGKVNIAYQVIGDGPLDLVYVPGWVSHLEPRWEDPDHARFLQRLASFSRLITFDKRLILKRRRKDMASNESSLQMWSPRLLSVLRIVTALLFMMHGTAKLFQMPHQAMFDNLQLMSLLGLQGVLEAGGGLLLLIGLFSRPVAFVLSGDMAVAYFMSHWPKSWLPILNGGDLAVLFCFVFLYLCVAGPGPWSVDARFRSTT